MPFVNTSGGGLNVCFPDVCDTYVGTSTSSITYPNYGSISVASGACETILINRAPAHNTNTTVDITNGDALGILGGIISGDIMEESKTVLGSTNLILKGMPAAKMLGITGHNGSLSNGVGSTLTPSQVKVMSMR